MGYDTQFVENIDFRLKIPDWRRIDYIDDDWEYAIDDLTDDHKTVLQYTPNLEIYEIRPVEVKDHGNGHYFLDFGHEITGQFKMTAKGIAGQIIEILCGEELEDVHENKVRYKMRCNCTYK